MADIPAVAADLRAKLSKAESKVKRYESALESARAERDELTIAMRVLAKHGYMDDAEADASPRVPGMNEMQATVYECTAYGEVSALAPKDVAAMLHSRGREDISPDYVRTTLWRLAQRGILRSDNGLYWRAEPIPAKDVAAPDAETSEADNGTVGPHGGGSGFPSSSPEGSSPSGSTPSSFSGAAALLENDDDDVPF